MSQEPGDRSAPGPSGTRWGEVIVAGQTSRRDAGRPAAAALAIRLAGDSAPYVEGLVRREAALVGGSVRVGRKRETVFPLEWTDPSHRSLGHLVPDIVVVTRTAVHVVDAKYKAHMAELDEHGWQRFTEDAREAHRADIHQVLAYAALYSADEVNASLVYPLRRATFEALARRGRDRSVAHLLHGARRVRLELRGVPFGSEAVTS